ncbi:Napsin-A, variant 2 [Clonorchis sinensis]|uniref:Napsin-A, variant 2 n=1 Tax=Clonorchis sinensis TaxID=79923 RepID=A0A8T1MVV3_CLOSI|nr:Napsin-A, variant 2 [Clonorchis sinensis]
MHCLALLLCVCQIHVTFTFKVELHYPTIGLGQVATYSGIHKPLLVEIEVGTPPQRFVVLLDTTSDLIMLSSSDCNAPHWQNARRFEKGISHTIQPRNRHFQRAYHTGEVKVELFADYVYFGGRWLGLVEFGLVCEQVTPINDLPGIDGVIGLSAETLSPEVSLTLLERITTTYPDYYQIFWLSFVENANEVREDGPVADLHFGSSPVSGFVEPMLYFPFNQRPRWLVHLLHVSFAEDVVFDGPLVAELVTATQFMVVNDRYLAGFTRVFGEMRHEGAHRYIDCNRIPTLPDLVFHYTAGVLTLTGEQYIGRAVQK